MIWEDNLAGLFRLVYYIHFCSQHKKKDRAKLFRDGT